MLPEKAPTMIDYIRPYLGSWAGVYFHRTSHFAKQLTMNIRPEAQTVQLNKLTAKPGENMGKGIFKSTLCHNGVIFGKISMKAGVT